MAYVATTDGGGAGDRGLLDHGVFMTVQRVGQVWPVPDVVRGVSIR